MIPHECEANTYDLVDPKIGEGKEAEPPEKLPPYESDEQHEYFVSESYPKQD